LKTKEKDREPLVERKNKYVSALVAPGKHIYRRKLTRKMWARVEEKRDENTKGEREEKSLLQLSPKARKHKESPHPYRRDVQEAGLQQNESRPRNRAVRRKNGGHRPGPNELRKMSRKKTGREKISRRNFPDA